VQDKISLRTLRGLQAIAAVEMRVNPHQIPKSLPTSRITGGWAGRCRPPMNEPKPLQQFFSAISPISGFQIVEINMPITHPPT
jgi:hypothetical protein